MGLNDFLSDYGKRVYLPNGILIQSAEAAQYCTDFNATAGVAKNKSKIMYLDSSRKLFSEEMTPAEIYAYSPIGGNKKLRELWKQHIMSDNCITDDKNITTPVVTSGLTNALSLAFMLFAQKGTDVVYPCFYWENYDLIFDVQTQAEKHPYEMFSGDGYNVEAFKKTVDGIKSNKIITIFNFPNNPTGYTLTESEADEISSYLKKKASEGKKIIAVMDDAYYSLFFEKSAYKKSLFSKLYNSDPNLLAVKCDAATKEELSWGFRVGFMTYGCADNSFFEELNVKTLGTIRGNISNANTVSQNVLIHSMQSEEHDKQKQEAFDILYQRYTVVKSVIKKMHEKYPDSGLRELPFNSGYFMSFISEVNADEIRLTLLKKYSTGLVALGSNLIRIAFSVLDIDKIESFYENVFACSQELKNRK